MSKKRKNKDDAAGAGAGFNVDKSSKRQKVHSQPQSLVKRARDYSSADADFAVLFEGLSSENNQQRENASQAFVSKCAAVFKAGASDPLYDFVDLQRPRNVYVRLIRGTCSTAKKSRVGFSMTLARLLEQHVYDDRFSHRALDLVVEHTRPGQDALRSEKRECLVGRMTAYDALLQAGLFSTKSNGQVDTRFVALVDGMCGLVSDAPHVLKDLCGAALCRAVENLAAISASSDHASAIIKSVCSHDLARTPEGVAVWLEVAEKATDAKLPRDVWHHRDPLSKHDRPALLKILRKGNDPGEDESSKEKDTSGRREAQPSFAWNVLLRHLAKKSSAALSAGKSDPYDSFWIEAVDNAFFAEKASDNRKSLGFQILMNQLKDLSQPVKPAIFSPKLLQCLQNQCSSTSNKVFGPAKGAVLAMESRAKVDATAALVIFQALAIRAKKFVDFDSLVSASGVKVVQSILKSTSDDILVSIARIIGAIQFSHCTDAERTQIEEGVAGFVLQAIRLRKQSLSDSVVRKESWAFLMIQVLFGWICDSGSKSTDAVKTRFHSCIAELIACCPEGAATVPTNLILDHRQRVGPSPPALAQASESMKKTEANAVKVLENLTSSKTNVLLKAFRLLLSVTLLQVYTGDAEATELLGDLYKSYDEAWRTSEPATGSTDAIIEIVMSFASKSSLSRRKLSEMVFPDFATGMSLEALRSMTEVLIQPESVTGQKALFDEGPAEAEADSEEAAADGDSDVEMDSDVEEAEGDSSDENAASDAGSDSSDASANSADQRLDEALGSLFGTSNNAAADAEPPKRANGSTNGAASDSDSDSDSSMDDEQMLALEPQLAHAFRQRAAAHAAAPPTGKKAHAAARQTMLDFKNRVLDLLALFLRASPAHPLAPHALLPLLRAVRLTKAPQVADKALRTLSAFVDAAKARGLPAMYVPGDEDDGGDGDAGTALLASPSSPPPPGLAPAQELPPVARTVFGTLVAVHDEALRFASRRHTVACSRASLFLARCLFAAEGVEREGARAIVAYLYTRTQLLRGAGGAAMPLHFFKDFVDWDAAMAGAAAGKELL